MLAVAGLTVTEATGTLVTVMADVPLCPSLVAVIVAEPAATPVTNPLAQTVATAGVLVAHGTAPPMGAAPFASAGGAVHRVVPPTVPAAPARLTVTEATGTFVTMAVAVPLRFWLVAVIVADPAAMPVMRPLVLTVATAGLVLDHVTLTATLSPFFVFPYAVNCAARPTDTNAVLGVSTTCASKPRFFTREVADTCVVPEAAAVGALGVG